MALTKENEIGKITVSNNVIEDAVAMLCQEPDLYDRVWLAQKPGVYTKYNDNGDVELKVSVYIKFGKSIRETSTSLSNKLARLVEDKYGKKPATITINVAGIKSQNLYKRNIDVVLSYE